MPDGFPDELSEFDKQWLTLVGERAGETVSAALQLFAEPEDDEAFYRRAATALLELRAETLLQNERFSAGTAFPPRLPARAAVSISGSVTGTDCSRSSR